MDNLKSSEIDKSSLKTKKKDLSDWVVYTAIALMITFFLNTFIGRIIYVDGKSMQPSLQDNDTLISEKITQRFGEFKKGDIVIINASENYSKLKEKYNHNILIKRIIGVENDVINIKNGKVFVNGEAILEDYIDGKETLSEGGSFYVDVKVPKDSVYVLGDNREPKGSIDSRVLGVFNIDDIKGRAALRIFPIKSFNLFK